EVPYETHCEIVQIRAFGSIGRCADAAYPGRDLGPASRRRRRRRWEPLRRRRPQFFRWRTEFLRAPRRRWTIVLRRPAWIFRRPAWWAILLRRHAWLLRRTIFLGSTRLFGRHP